MRIEHPVDSWSHAFSRGVEGLRVGVPGHWCLADLEPEVERRVREAIDTLRTLGVVVEEIMLPDAHQAQARLMPMVHADAAAVHARRLEEQPGRFGAV
jgi:aspartyl-tRNA(Asn)/glutamyl-tRNA(Gln) amidotransferase subunit A